MPAASPYTEPAYNKASRLLDDRRGSIGEDHRFRKYNYFAQALHNPQNLEGVLHAET
jgi:hypothetical protein